MEKLTGYKNVAVIRQGYYEDRDYYFAIYEDLWNFFEDTLRLDVIKVVK